MGKTQEIGGAAEEQAYRYLENKGLKFVTRNFRCRLGEIDLIMKEKEALIFIEVRCRHGDGRFGTSQESVTFAKQRKIIKTANYYLQIKQLYGAVPCRFDVVTVAFQQGAAKVEWIKNAFIEN